MVSCGCNGIENCGLKLLSPVHLPSLSVSCQAGHSGQSLSGDKQEFEASLGSMKLHQKEQEEGQTEDN